MSTTFITPVSLPRGNCNAKLPTQFMRGAIHCSTLRSRRTASVTSKNRPTASGSDVTTASSNRRTRALVIDSYIKNLHEAHHWITVASGHMRLFERAASAQADVTRVVEQRTGTGANSRWVLRETPDPTLGLETNARFGNDVGTYVVMESFKEHMKNEEEDLTKRWLAAVKRVGKMFEAVDIKSLGYINVFTTEVHGTVSVGEECVVLVDSFSSENDTDVGKVLEVLKSGGESAVAVGQVIKFCILKGMNERGFFKTVSVYKNGHDMKRHLDSSDKVFEKRLHGRINAAQRSRHMFRPIVVN